LYAGTDCHSIMLSQSLIMWRAFFFLIVHILSLVVLVVTIVAVSFAGCRHNESVTEWVQTIPMSTVQNDEFTGHKTFKILKCQLFFLPSS
jgi:hypothetical protein